MLGVTDIWTYVFGTIAIVLLPGPNSIFVLSTAARHGVRPGYRAAAGVFLGDWLLMRAAALGVASLLRAYPAVFMIIKYAGAGYLAYIGVTMAVAAIRRGAAAPPRRRRPAATRTGSAGAVPAGAGHLPAQPEGDPVRHLVLHPVPRPAYAQPALSFLLLASILQVCSAIYLSGLIFGGTFLAAQFRRRRRLASGLTAGVGAVFIGFGIRLATASLG